MVDFCYSVNWLILIWAFFLKEEVWIFCVLYTFSFGLTLWGVPIFQNCVVLHSADKFISCYIHLMPSVLMFKFRWTGSPDMTVCTPHENVYTSVTVESSCPGMSEFDSFVALYGLSTLGYLMLAFLQYFVTHAHPKVRKDKEYLTAHRYLVRHPQSWPSKNLENNVGILKKCCPCLSKGLASEIAIQVGALFAYILPMLPIYALWRSFYLNALFLVLIMVIAAWNGANFYMEIFVVRYASMHTHYYNKRRMKRGLLRTVGTQCHHQQIERAMANA